MPHALPSLPDLNVEYAAIFLTHAARLAHVPPDDVEAWICGCLMAAERLREIDRAREQAATS